MKLLILTQKVDKNDDVLGFFHGWIREFAKHCEYVTVVCLEKGVHDFPENVSVFSLGKEAGGSRVTYIARFYHFIWKERKKYDAVFVHMNQEYLLLGGFIWKVLGKRVALWYNHTHGNILTNLAVRFTYKVFHTSPFAYTARFSHAMQMPVGIDTEVFYPLPSISRAPRSVVYIGRLSHIKKVHIMIQAFHEFVSTSDTPATFDIYGAPGDHESGYMNELRAHAGSLEDHNCIVFHGKINNTSTPQVYSASDVSINLTPRGNYDKTIFESMACGTLALVTNPALKGIVHENMLVSEDGSDLKEKLTATFAMEEEEKAKYREKLKQYVESEHSLKKLGKKVISVLQGRDER